MSKMKKLLVVLTVMVSVVAAGFVIAASTITAGKTVEVTSAQKFTTAALGKGTNLGTIANGTTATVVSVSKDYARIKLTNSGLTGWVKLSGLKLTEIVKPLTVGDTNKITKDWQTSAHATSSVEDPTTGITTFMYTQANGSCQPCHNGNVLAGDLTYKSNTQMTGANYNATPKVTSASIDITKVILPKAIVCETCHGPEGSKIMDTGVVPASLFNATNSSVAYGPKGTTDWKVGNKNALCFTCHNARNDVNAAVTSYLSTDPTVKKATNYPHHGWDALVAGQGAEYPGVTYAKNSAHMTLGCVGCHMGKDANGHISHTFKPNPSVCAKCHTDVKTAADFEKKSAKAKETLTAKLQQVNDLIVKLVPGATKAGEGRGQLPAVGADGKAISVTDGDVWMADYNYIMVKQEVEKTGGIHNAKYANSLLDESIKRLTPKVK